MPISDREIRPMIMGSIRFIIKSGSFVTGEKGLQQFDFSKQDEEKKCVCKNIAAAHMWYKFIIVLFNR